MNYLVTGACGFVGSNLCRSLLLDGHHVEAIDNLSIGRLEILQMATNDVETGKLKIHISDITDFDEMLKLTKNVDYIIHLAGLAGVRDSIEDPWKWFENNAIGSFNIFEVSRINKVKKIVWSSTSAALGQCEIADENQPANPISPYGASKLSAEGLASAYYYSYDLPIITLRFSNVFGLYCHMKPLLVPKFLKAVVNKKTFEIYGDGLQTRDLIHVDDIISAIKMSIDSDIKCETFQVCTGIKRTVNDIIYFLKEEIKKYGYDINIINTEPKIGDVRSNSGNNSKIKNLLGWEPKSDFEKSLKNTIKWYIKNFG